jgi:hypothetical protein
MVRAAALRAQRRHGALASFRLDRAASNPLGASGAQAGLADLHGGDAGAGPLTHAGRASKPIAKVGSCCHGCHRSFARDVDLQRSLNCGAGARPDTAGPRRAGRNIPSKCRRAGPVGQWAAKGGVYEFAAVGNSHWPSAAHIGMP